MSNQNQTPKLAAHPQEAYLEAMQRQAAERLARQIASSSDSDSSDSSDDDSIDRQTSGILVRHAAAANQWNSAAVAAGTPAAAARDDGEDSRHVPFDASPASPELPAAAVAVDDEQVRKAARSARRAHNIESKQATESAQVSSEDPPGTAVVLCKRDPSKIGTRPAPGEIFSVGTRKYMVEGMVHSDMYVEVDKKQNYNFLPNYEVMVANVTASRRKSTKGLPISRARPDFLAVRCDLRGGWPDDSNLEARESIVSNKDFTRMYIVSGQGGVAITDLWVEPGVLNKTLSDPSSLLIKHEDAPFGGRPTMSARIPMRHFRQKLEKRRPRVTVEDEQGDFSQFAAARAVASHLNDPESDSADEAAPAESTFLVPYKKQRTAASSSSAAAPVGFLMPSVSVGQMFAQSSAAAAASAAAPPKSIKKLSPAAQEAVQQAVKEANSTPLIKSIHDEAIAYVNTVVIPELTAQAAQCNPVSLPMIEFNRWVNHHKMLGQDGLRKLIDIATESAPVTAKRQVLTSKPELLALVESLVAEKMHDAVRGAKSATPEWISHVASEAAEASIGKLEAITANRFMLSRNTLNQAMLRQHLFTTHAGFAFLQQKMSDLMQQQFQQSMVCADGEKQKRTKKRKER